MKHRGIVKIFLITFSVFILLVSYYNSYWADTNQNVSGSSNLFNLIAYDNGTLYNEQGLNNQSLLYNDFFFLSYGYGGLISAYSDVSIPATYKDNITAVCYVVIYNNVLQNKSSFQEAGTYKFANLSSPVTESVSLTPGYHVARAYVELIMKLNTNQTNANKTIVNIYGDINGSFYFSIVNSEPSTITLAAILFGVASLVIGVTAVVTNTVYRKK